VNPKYARAAEHGVQPDVVPADRDQPERARRYERQQHERQVRDATDLSVLDRAAP
jgi:hypothetical protein